MKISNISKITTAIFLFTVFCYGESVYSLPPIPICTVSNNVLTIDGRNVEKKPSSASKSQSSTSTSASSSVSSSSANFPELDRAQADKIIYQLAMLKLKPILKVKICNWKIKRREIFKEILEEILEKLLDGIEMAAELDEIEISNTDLNDPMDLARVGKLLRSRGLIQIHRENTGDNNSLYYKRGIYLRNNILVIDGKNFDNNILKVIEETITPDGDDNSILPDREKEKIVSNIKSGFLDKFAQQISGLEFRNLRLEGAIAVLFLEAIFDKFGGADLTSINIHNVDIADGMAPVIIDLINGKLSGRLTSVRYFGNYAVRESDHLKIIRALGQYASLHILDVSQNVLSVDLVELLQEIMPRNTDIAQVYLSRNAVKESEIELLRFCNKPESRFLNFVVAGIRGFDFVNAPRVDETLRTIQERNFAIWRLLAKPKANLSNFRDKFFKSEAELVAAILRKDGSLSTLPISEENEMLGAENLDLIAAIRGTHARLNSILDQLLAPRASLSSDAKNTYLILSQLLLNSPTTSSSASSTSSSGSSQNWQLSSVSIDDNNINSTSSQWSLNSITTSSSTSSTSSSSSSQSELPSVTIDNNNILHINGNNSDLPDNIQETQIIYLLNSIDSRPVLGVEIHDLRLTDGTFLLKILHTLLDNNRSAVAELSTLNIDRVLVAPNNSQLRDETVKLLESFGFVLELASDGLSPITIHSQRYLYLRNNVLIIDGTNISNPILTGSLVEVVENFLNKNNYLVSGLVLQNWELNDNSIGSLFDAIMKRVDKNFSSISILDIKEVERASDFAGSLSRLIAAVKDSLKTIRYRRNNLLRSEDHLRIVQSLNECTTALHTLDFGHSNISAEMAALLRGVIENSRKLLQIYLPQCVFNEAGALTFLRSCLLPTEIALYFDEITIEDSGFTSMAPTVAAAIRSFDIMQQRNIALRELLVNLLYNHLEVADRDREKLIKDIVYGSEEAILNTKGLKAMSMLNNMDYAAVTSIRELQLNLRNLQAQPDNMPVVDSYPAPSAARVKKMQQKEVRISSLACNGRATPNNNSLEGAASNSVTEWLLSLFYLKNYSKK